MIILEYPCHPAVSPVGRDSHLRQSANLRIVEPSSSDLEGGHLRINRLVFGISPRATKNFVKFSARPNGSNVSSTW